MSAAAILRGVLYLRKCAADGRYTERQDMPSRPTVYPHRLDIQHPAPAPRIVDQVPGGDPTATQEQINKWSTPEYAARRRARNEQIARQREADQLYDRTRSPPSAEFANAAPVTPTPFQRVSQYAANWANGVPTTVDAVSEPRWETPGELSGQEAREWRRKAQAAYRYRNDQARLAELQQQGTTPTYQRKAVPATRPQAPTTAPPVPQMAETPKPPKPVAAPPRPAGAPLLAQR